MVSMQYKHFKISWGAYMRLRHLFAGQRGETMDDYIRRLTKFLEETEERQAFADAHRFDE